MCWGASILNPMADSRCNNQLSHEVGNRVLGGMRVPDEFVRHRVLDLVGDMAMAGAPLLGRVSALRPSHEMNYRLVAALLADRDAWEWAEFAVLVSNKRAYALYRRLGFVELPRRAPVSARLPRELESVRMEWLGKQ
ncbi:hypothetical protein OKW37_006279 [Paraburkholderia sp. MM5482-R2]